MNENKGITLYINIFVKESMVKFLKKIDIKKAVTHNILLKLACLVFAILVWLYVSGMIAGPGGGAQV